MCVNHFRINLCYSWGGRFAWELETLALLGFSDWVWPGAGFACLATFHPLFLGGDVGVEGALF